MRNLAEIQRIWDEGKGGLTDAERCFMQDRCPHKHGVMYAYEYVYIGSRSQPRSFRFCPDCQKRMS